MNEAYIRTVQLLLEVAPAVFETSTFAMKGGTALNLFVQDMPRLSVDIDVVFVPYELGRDAAMEAISDGLASVQKRIEALGHHAELRRTREGTDAKLFVRSAQAEVKVEVNFVFRGTVLPPERRSLVPAAQTLFSADIHEVLFPNEKPLEAVFASEFEGMTAIPAHLAELLRTRSRMLSELPRALLPRHCKFLMSMVRAEPDWTLLPYPHLQQLPALQWKLQNLERLRKNAGKFQLQHDELAARLARARA